MIDLVCIAFQKEKEDSEKETILEEIEKRKKRFLFFTEIELKSRRKSEW